MKANKRFVADMKVLWEPKNLHEGLPRFLDRIALATLGICGLAIGALIQYLFASAVFFLAAIGAAGVLGLVITYVTVLIALPDILDD